MPGPEPRVFLGGTILGPSAAEALYVEDGRVVAVGSRTEVLRSVPTGSERVELEGRCVIPGLVDAHLHVGASIRVRGSVDLSGARSLRELLDVLEGFLARRPGPVLGGGWDQERLREGRMPTRADLDRLPTDQPIVLYRHCGHVATLNSAALAAAGLTDATPDPANGSLGRAGGALDGRLFDGAMSVLPDLEDRWYPLAPDIVRRWFQEEASFGVTAVGAMSAEPAELRQLREATSTGPLAASVSAYLRARWLGEATRLRRELDGPSLRVNGLKVMADGSLGARTAWLSEPYSDAPATAGTPLVGPGELEEVLRTGGSLGMTTAVHAIGDGAFRNVLEALDRVPDRGPVRIEHASIAPPALIDRAVAHGVPLVVQPSFVRSDGWVPERLGPARARWAYPFRTLLSRGARLAGSSDSPIESRDPWRGLTDAVATRAGVGASESLGAQQALTLYTQGGWEALGQPAEGTLARGTSADLVVLEAPRWADAIPKGRSAVVATYRAGHCTYDARVDQTAQVL